MTEIVIPDETETSDALSGEAVSGPLAEEGNTDTVDETTDDPETFPREYVVKLRDESAKYRQKAADRDDLAARLHAALVTATGRLADPSDLAFDDAHIDDPEALTAAIDNLLTCKPHLATRKPTGDVGQGATGTGDTADLASLLRRNAS